MSSARRSLVVGVAALVLAIVGAIVFDSDQFFRSYLIAVLFWLGIAVGCLAIALLHQLTGGQWGVAIERLAESGARTIPWLALAFVPLLFWLPGLYEWARPAVVAAEDRLQGKTVYLNVPFFVIRAAVYFVAWTALAWTLDRWSRARDRSADARVTVQLKRLGAAGALVIAFTVSFAAIDWMMSLEPLWYSTVYGGMVGVGWMLSAFAFVIAVATLSATRSPFRDVLSPKVRIDLGNLLLTFVILWTYLAFVQLLIIWAGNEREEVVWYVRRLNGGWQGIAAFLAIAQFFVPLGVLLFRAAKQNTRVMAMLATLILFTSWINTLWLVSPAFHPATFTIHWLDVLTVIGIGGLWIARFIAQLDGRAPVPLHDPALPLEIPRYVHR